MNNKNQINRHLKQQRINNGLCPMCATRPLAVNRKACRRCLDLANNRRKAKYNSKKNSIICMLCLSKPRYNNHTMCLDCLNYKTTYRLNIKLEAFKAYGGNKCACGDCPLSIVSDHKFLAIDHIYNNRDQQKRSRGYDLYLWLRKQQYPHGYRVLCHNCNSGRQLNNGFCPHIINSTNDVSRQAKQRLKLRFETLDKYGGRQCACITCPEHNNPHIKFLTIDHINDDGAIHRKEIATNGIYTNQKMLNWLKKNNWPPGFQILCFNCNIAHSLNNGTCPHVHGNNITDN